MSTLRDWMDKRSERKQAAKANNGGKQRPEEEPHIENTTVDESQPNTLHDFSNTPPPPPPPRSKARDNQPARLIPPAPGLLNRYKNGSQTQPAPSTSAPSAKGSAFSEHFDRRSSKTVRRVNGIDFEMSSAPNGGDALDSGREENQIGGERGRPDIKTRRSSRSRSRRQERQDSHTMIEEDAPKLGELDLTLDIPESLQIHKTQTAQQPSPQAHDDNAAPRKGIDGALRKLSLDGDADVQHPPTTKNGATVTSPPRTKSGSSPFIQRLKGSLSKPSSSANTNTTSPAPPAFIPPADDEPDLTKFIPPDNPTVAVRPPIYDMTKNPSQQWESDLGSTSRPARPWDWPKRWTCCKCEGQTIVEQIVCSNLDCVHDRCPANCRVVRWADRPGGRH